MSTGLLETTGTDMTEQEITPKTARTISYQQARQIAHRLGILPKQEIHVVPELSAEQIRIVSAFIAAEFGWEVSDTATVEPLTMSELDELTMHQIASEKHKKLIELLAGK